MRQCDSGGKAQVLVSAHLTQRMIEGEERRRTRSRQDTDE